MRYGPIVTNWVSLGRAATCMQLGFKIDQVNPAEIILRLPNAYLTYVPSVATGKRLPAKL